MPRKIELNDIAASIVRVKVGNLVDAKEISGNRIISSR